MAVRAGQAMAARDVAMYGGDTYRRGATVTDEPRGRMCGAAGCASSWVAPWKKRTRPIFEGEWGCGGRCLAALVAAAVRREVGEGAGMRADAPHRHRVPLGLVLLAQGWITHPQLQRALESQKASGQGRIGDWLQQGCGLEEERITRGLGVQWNCPVLATEGFSAAAMALVMPKRFVQEFGLVPLRVAGSSLLYLAFEDRMNAVAALGLEQMSGLKVESGLLTGSQYDGVKSAVLSAESVPVKMQAVSDTDGLSVGIVRALEQRQPVGARLVRVQQYYWLRMWLESGAKSGVGSLPTGVEDVEDCLFVVGRAA